MTAEGTRLRRRTVLGGVLIVAMTAVFIVWIGSRPPSSRVEINIGGPFTLIDQNGLTRSEADFAGRFLLVYFGYTFCPDVCPTALQDMSSAVDSLGEKGEKVTPVFITVDPERDTVAQMKDYAEHFHPRMVALTGTPERIREAAKAYRVYYARADADVGEGAYLMDHTSLIFLMGPDGRYLAQFPYGTTPDEIAASLEKFL